MADKQPMQASGEGGDAAAPDGVNTGGGRTGKGQDGGGPYKEKIADKDGGFGGFMGHGGQTVQTYYGGGEPGDDEDKTADDRNAAKGA